MKHSNHRLTAQQGPIPKMKAQDKYHTKTGKKNPLQSHSAMQQDPPLAHTHSTNSGKIASLLPIYGNGKSVRTPEKFTTHVKKHELRAN